VLRPGGRLALFWNAFSYPPGVAAAFADLHRRLLPELPFLRAARRVRLPPTRRCPSGPLPDSASAGVRRGRAVALRLVAGLYERRVARHGSDLRRTRSAPLGPARRVARRDG
jgi:hypothetical protein